MSLLHLFLMFCISLKFAFHLLQVFNVPRITIYVDVSSNLCVWGNFGFTVISKDGAGQLDLLILDTLYKVCKLFFNACN